MGILLVYDCTDESSFNNIRNWIRNIETHAADSVNKVRTRVCLSCLIAQREETKMCTDSIPIQRSLLFIFYFFVRCWSATSATC